MSKLRSICALIPFSIAVGAGAADGPGAQSLAPPANDYSKQENWLCRPNQPDACAVELDATSVAADGSLTREPFHADPSPPVDCFYVYPTVSLDPTPNSDMTPGPEERAAVKHQFARFAARCRIFAPLYRQVTLEELRRTLRGESNGGEHALAYGDVLAAWHYYLRHDNHGRGVVLVGHSQGAALLVQLLQQEFEGKPLQAQLVSAVLAGGGVAVPEDSDVGATFKTIPLCREPSQFGCVIAYASFRATSPPPSDAIAGRNPAAGQVAACTNPARLSGGEGELKAYLVTYGRAVTNTLPAPPWVKDGPDIGTPFVTVPGLLSAHCARDDHGSYLAVAVHGDPADPRADDITGDVYTHDAIRPRWGLHPIDLDLTLGNLLDLVGTQSQAWQQAHRKQPKHTKRR